MARRHKPRRSPRLIGSVADGRVVSTRVGRELAGLNFGIPSEAGDYVLIRDGADVFYLYSHLASVSPIVGDLVSAGREIGLTTAADPLETFTANGPHLVEVRPDEVLFEATVTETAPTAETA
jgi:murein DD-endopeptidase MepM/ murein hydrolase activator NlpD